MPPTAPPIFGGLLLAPDNAAPEDAELLAPAMWVDSPDVWFVEANWIFCRNSFLHAFDLVTKYFEKLSLTLHQREYS